MASDTHEGQRGEPQRGERSVKVELATADVARALAGGHNEHFKLIERRCRVQIGQRGTTLTINGDGPSTAFVERLIGQLISLLDAGHPLFPEDVDQAVRLLSSSPTVDLKSIFLDTVMQA